jgi:hypothetical protein
MPGALLALLQLFFALTWIVYVIYLPELAAQAGLDRRYVPMILIMDQVIFLACDWWAGLYADRAARTVGGIGGTLAVATLASCGAFIALPWIAPAAGPFPFLLLTILWSATSSALRAPPLALVARHVSAEHQPWTTSLYLFGFGVASAVAPFLAIELRQVDPRIPFAAASLGLAAFVFALVAAEHRWSPAPDLKRAAPAAAERGTMLLFGAAVLLFAIGFQVHFAINSAPSYLRFARAEDLPKLMPVFWIGFNLAILPATLLPKRFGGAIVMAAAGFLGIVALIASVRAPGLEPLMIAEAMAGAAWGIALTSAMTAALEAGRTGREGLFTGLLFSTMAASALIRLGLIVGHVPAHASFGPRLVDLPIAAWLVASFLAAVVAFRVMRGDQAD